MRFFSTTQIAESNKLAVPHSIRTNLGLRGRAPWAGPSKEFSLLVRMDQTSMPVKDLQMARFWQLVMISAWLSFSITRAQLKKQHFSDIRVTRNTLLALVSQRMRKDRSSSFPQVVKINASFSGNTLLMMLQKPKAKLTLKKSLLFLMRTTLHRMRSRKMMGLVRMNLARVRLKRVIREAPWMSGEDKWKRQFRTIFVRVEPWERPLITI